MNYKLYNDYELIYMVRENDGNVKEILYKKYEPILKNIANEFYFSYKYYGYDFDDFYQEALISFESAIASFDENQDSLFYTFITLCVRRRLISFCRNISNEKKNIANYNIVELDENIKFNDDDIEKKIINNDLIDICKKAIWDLPIENSIVLELKINGFTYREIGELLDVPRSSAEYRIRKAKSYIRQLINEYNCK